MCTHASVCTHTAPPPTPALTPRPQSSWTLPDPSQPLPVSPRGRVAPTFCPPVPAVSPLTAPSAPATPGCPSPAEAGAAVSPGTQHPAQGSVSGRRLPPSTRCRNRTVFSSQQSEALEEGEALTGPRPRPQRSASLPRAAAGCWDGAGPFPGRSKLFSGRAPAPLNQHHHRCSVPNRSSLVALGSGDGLVAAAHPSVARHGLELCQGGFRLEIGEISLLREWSGVGPGCPGQWGSPHPWRGV